MRRLFLLAGISATLAAGAAGSALAGGLHGPTAQQTECLAEGGSFSAGYDADTYICVQTGLIQTCRFGGNSVACDTEQGPGQKRIGDQGVPTGPARPRAVPRFF